MVQQLLRWGSREEHPTIANLVGGCNKLIAVMRRRLASAVNRTQGALSELEARMRHSDREYYALAPMKMTQEREDALAALWEKSSA